MTTETTTIKKPLSRRTLLARLGLAAGVAYAAPVMLKLSEARASGFSGFSGFSGSGSGVRRRRRVQTQGHHTNGRAKTLAKTHVGARQGRRRHVRRSFSS